MKITPTIALLNSFHLPSSPLSSRLLNPKQIRCRLVKGILLWEGDEVLQHYYADYFSTLAALKGDHRQAHRLVSACRQLLLLSALYIGQFYLTQDGLSDTENMVMYNVVYLNGFEAPWNLAIAVFLLYARYLFTLMYYHNFGPSSALIHSLVVMGDGTFFRRRVRLTKSSRKRSLSEREADVRKMVEQIQILAIFLQNAFQLAFACNYLNFLWCEFIVSRHFYQKQLLFKDCTNSLAYLQFQLSLFIGTAITRLFAHSVLQTATFGILVMSACSRRLNQLQRLIVRTKPSEVDALWLRRFFRVNNQFLLLLYDINRVYGRALYATLVVGMPANALVIFIFAFHQRLSVLLQVIFVLSGILAVFFIFGVHLKVALIAAKLHCPAKKLMVVMAGWQCLPNADGGQLRRRRKTKGCLRLKLKTLRYVEQFYTTNQHTVTYGKFGKVTVKSFGRHLLYYTKMLIFVYGLLRNNSSVLVKRFN